MEFSIFKPDIGNGAFFQTDTQPPEAGMEGRTALPDVFIKGKRSSHARLSVASQLVPVFFKYEIRIKVFVFTASFCPNVPRAKAVTKL